jgi:hypothetical protein
LPAVARLCLHTCCITLPESSRLRWSQAGTLRLLCGCGLLLHCTPVAHQHRSCARCADLRAPARTPSGFSAHFRDMRVRIIAAGRLLPARLDCAPNPSSRDSRDRGSVDCRDGPVCGGVAAVPRGLRSCSSSLGPFDSSDQAAPFTVIIRLVTVPSTRRTVSNTLQPRHARVPTRRRPRPTPGAARTDSHLRQTARRSRHRP